LLSIGIGVNLIGDLKLTLSFGDLLKTMHQHHWEEVINL
jgi:hypothetical protein